MDVIKGIGGGKHLRAGAMIAESHGVGRGRTTPSFGIRSNLISPEEQQKLNQIIELS